MVPMRRRSFVARGLLTTGVFGLGCGLLSGCGGGDTGEGTHVETPKKQLDELEASANDFYEKKHKAEAASRHK